MLLTLYLLAAIVNIGGRLSNYNIRNHPLDIRVKRDVLDKSINSDVNEDDSRGDASLFLNNNEPINGYIEESPSLIEILRPAQDKNNQKRIDQHPRFQKNLSKQRFKFPLEELTSLEKSVEYDNHYVQEPMGSDEIVKPVNKTPEETYVEDAEEEPKTKQVNVIEEEKNKPLTKEDINEIDEEKIFDNEQQQKDAANRSRVIRPLYESTDSTTLAKISGNISLGRVKRKTPYSGLYNNNYTHNNYYSYPYTKVNGSWVPTMFSNMSTPYTRNNTGPMRFNNGYGARYPTSVASYYNRYNGTVTSYNQYRQTEGNYINSYSNINQRYNGGTVPLSNYPYNANNTYFTNLNYNQANNGIYDLNNNHTVYNNRGHYTIFDQSYTINPGRNIYRPAINLNQPSYNTNQYNRNASSINNFNNNYNSINNSRNNLYNNSVLNKNEYSNPQTPRYAPGYTTGYDGKVSTTTPPTTPKIDKSCILCGSIGCPAFFKKIGIFCIPASETQ